MRHRDRHGRGLRGSLLPPEAPFARTRAERFDGFVRDEVSRLGQRWGRELAQVEFAVEEVPPVAATEAWLPGAAVPLAQTRPGEAGRPPRIVIYRRPVEARGGMAPGAGAAGGDDREVIRLVRDLLVEEVADLLGLSPESVDPSYDTPDD